MALLEYLLLMAIRLSTSKSNKYIMCPIRKNMKVVLIVLVLPNCTREQTTGDILCVQPEEIESFGVIDRPLSME